MDSQRESLKPLKGRLSLYLAAIIVSIPVCFALAQTAKSFEYRSSISQLQKNTPQRSSEGGFVSSNSCKACHPEAYHSWHQTYHRTMTQLASPDTVVGDFSGVEFEYFGAKFLLERRGNEYWVRVNDGWRRVVQTTGSHHYQMYWLESDGDGGDGNLDNRLENLPIVYMIKERKWVRRNDIFLLPPDVANQPDGIRLWNATCISCHSTYGQPRVDNLEQPDTSAQTVVGELGIACEACHGPAHDHVKHYSDPWTRYLSRLSGDSPVAIVNPAGMPHHRSSEVCGQCHGISAPANRSEWNESGEKYRAGDELGATRRLLRHPARIDLPHNRRMSSEMLDRYFWSDGMVRVSGREYNGLVESPCFQRGNLSCISCHSMHDSDPVDQLKSDMLGDHACLQCHTEVADNISSHTNHDINSSGSRCYNCHMPHTTYGLVKAIRSHEIDSPDVSTSLVTGRPNACNLCHLDKTLSWTNDHLVDWYGKQHVAMNSTYQSTSAALIWLLAGDAGQRAIIAWHAGWEPAKVASGSDWLAPFLAELLNDDYAVVRNLAGKALASLPAMDGVVYDYVAEEAERKSAAEKFVEIWNRQSHSGTARPELLLNDGWQIDYGRLFKLLGKRDRRPVDLLE